MDGDRRFMVAFVYPIDRPVMQLFKPVLHSVGRSSLATLPPPTGQRK
jgi:hypothetical protein